MGTDDSRLGAPPPPERPASSVNLPASVSRYAGAAATVVWTLGWIAAACHASQHVGRMGGGAALLNLVVTFACSALGGIMTIRIIRHLPGARTEAKPEASESGLRRLTGWLAAFVWCGAAVVWNLAVYRSLVRAIANGPAAIVLLLIPFSVIGWFLLNVLFVTLGVIFDGFLDGLRGKIAKRFP